MRVCDSRSLLSISTPNQILIPFVFPNVSSRIRQIEIVLVLFRTKAAQHRVVNNTLFCITMYILLSLHEIYI